MSNSFYYHISGERKCAESNEIIKLPTYCLFNYKNKWQREFKFSPLPLWQFFPQIFFNKVIKDTYNSVQRLVFIYITVPVVEVMSSKRCSFSSHDLFHNVENWYHFMALS